MNSETKRLLHALATLDQRFHRLYNMGLAAQVTGDDKMFERCMRLALKAQARCAQAAEALIKQEEDARSRPPANAAKPSTTPTPAAARQISHATFTTNACDNPFIGPAGDLNITRVIEVPESPLTDE